ncbi:MAG: NAD(P)/FAD-dependent oxidoreductase [Deltaproteobacteria bacterium]|nr:NAD(P)/FAD-dependent oxidoreductase [Deltaproteobacteria bacterium]
MAKYDAIVIGAGHNGLVTAAYLAKAGKKILVLERRPVIGGIAASEEIIAGFKYATCAHLAGAFAPAIVSELNLQKHGLEILALDPLMFAPSLDGKPLLIPREQIRAIEEIRRHSARDAEKFAEFCALTKKLSEFLLTLYSLPLPDRATPGEFNPMELVKAAWKFHRLGKKEMYEFLRILPMSMADLLGEWFANEALKAAIAAASMLGSFVGPRQQGTAYNFLYHQHGAGTGAFRAAGLVRGGMSRIPHALSLAAQQRGAEIRTDAEVTTVTTKNGRATGVVLANGTEFAADVVISSVDVKKTFLKLVEPTYIDPQFLLQVKNIRARGTVAKVNLALDALPNFKSSTAKAAELGGIIHVGPTMEYLERAADDAKYGRVSEQPFLEITIPSISDPSLAPAGKHVMSVWMQSAPYHLKNGGWSKQRDALGDTVVSLIEEYAPGFKNSILHRQVLSPLDLERTYGLTEGHLYHAELALDQIFFMRPVPGWSRYHTPIDHLYLCGSGTHPGGGVTGLPGYYAAKEILKSLKRKAP